MTAHPRPAALNDRATALLSGMRRIDTISALLSSSYLVKGWLHRGALSVVYGESNVGKTFFGFDIAAHISSHTAWHGCRVSGGPVIYVAAEGGGGINNRVAAMRETHPEMCEVAELQILPVALDLCGPGDAPALIEAVESLGYRPSLHNPPALVVVDTLSRVMGAGDENTAKDMGQLIRNLDYIRATLKCHVMVVHHSGKDTAKGARGSSALRAAVDTEIELTRTDDVIVAEVRKQRDMALGGAFAYRLEDVELGLDDDGDPVTSAVVVPTDVPQKRKDLSGNELTLWEALHEFVADCGVPNPSGTGWPDAGRVRIVDLESFRQFANGRFSNSNPRQSVRRAMKGLQDAGRIGLNQGHIWPITDGVEHA